MTTRGAVRSRLLHIPLAALGLFVLFGTVAVTLVVGNALFHSIFLLLLGAPIGEVVETMSISRIVADLSGDLYGWMAGILLCILLLPLFMRYNDWLGRILYDQDADRDRDQGHALDSEP
ncbi:hypothetical protein [Natrialba sp. SSL1]|uniref:hypothetical protein n=1 Tax=Natrialba sp. SSL1 TaxID=1869245 RepID=UPI0008F954A4|nr:hypothetical protein [Natrialba sp. SSL1]OIB57041.1 hypothetical protein BBD46_14955 [Natrialba sp. SSL1]